MVCNTKLTIVTQNFNSYNYLPLSMLSLFSAFKALTELSDIGNSKVLLIDSASTDGSYEKLCQLGAALSKETGIDFESKRLGKDLGNSYAIAYGLLLEKKKGTRYVINMDNDFVIFSSDVVREMKHLAEEFDVLDVKYYAIAPMHLVGNRDKALKALDINGKLDLERSLSYLRNDLDHFSLLAFNVNFLDVLDRPLSAIRSISLREFYDIVNKVKREPRFLITSFVPATITLYNPKLAPPPPYFYLLGDDISAGLEHTRRGYISVVIPKIAGVHYVATSQKVNKVRLYLENRNSIIENPSGRSRRVLHKLLRLIYSILYISIDVFGFRQSVKQKLSSHTIKTPYHVRKLRMDEYKYIILGTIHGILRDGLIRELIERWFDKFVPVRGIDFSDYLRLSFSVWSNNSLSLKSILLFFLSAGKFIGKDAEINILVHRLKT